MGPKLNVLGTDPGFANFGYGVVDIRAKHPYTAVGVAGVLHTKKTDSKLGVYVADDNCRRCDELTEAFLEIVHTHDVRAICAESMSFVRNSSAAAKLAMAWGAVVAVCRLLDLPLVVATPKQIKIGMTGGASATKQEIEDQVIVRYGAQWVPPTIKKLEREHMFDAVASVYTVRDSQILRALR